MAENGRVAAPRRSMVESDRPSVENRRLDRRVATLMIVIAASLAVASTVHLAGHVQGRSDLFDARDAGIAEAVIGAVLLAGAVSMFSVPARARAVGLATTGFAIVGFVVGLSITARAGHLPDIAYHLTVLPFLIGVFVALYRSPRRSPAADR